MNIKDTLPIVADEPRISLVPIFYTNESKALTELVPASQYKRSTLNLKTFSTFSTLNVARKDSKCRTAPAKNHCCCPYILVADDDTFQHLYYKGLFQKALKSEEMSLKSQDLCLCTCFSGEELLEKLNKITECGCGTTRLVIVDYQMGEKELNGVETCIKVRKDGYKGNVLLRTSETEISLKKSHQDLDQLFQENIIDVLVNKSDATFGKKFIQKIVAEAIPSF